MIRYERDDRGDLWAVTDVPVGIERIPFRVPLGSWDRDDPGPGGLLQLPVVVLSRRSLGDVAHAAVSRSGRATAIDVSPAGRELLSVAEGGAEVLVVGDGNGRSMNAIRALGGRPLPALPSSDPAAVRAFLDGCRVDLDIAVPADEGARRDGLRAGLAELGLERTHHLVEVDARPGLEAAGFGPDEADDPTRWAAAAGVLAGRLAAGRRRSLSDRS